jgi:alpha-tubulin suppressor-like RCC1 family protein
MRRRMLTGLVALLSMGGVLAACGPQPISTYPVLISAGDFHTCGQDGAGKLECWGDNSAGELGNGTNTNSLTPVPVTGLSKVFDLSTAYDRTCIVTAYNGAVKCWGDNSNGGLGDGFSFSNHNLPTQVAGLTSGWKSVRVGYAFTCALSVVGAVKCWGAVPDSLGGLKNTPVDVAGLEAGAGQIPVGQITVGHDHACALLTSGAVECWGDNTNGELGNNSTTTADTPVAVTGISSGATDVAAGNRTTCAVVSTLDFCWGSNNSWQVGDGTLADRWIPTAVLGVGGSAFRASLSDRYSCILSNNGGVGAQCWGKNDLNQLGDGTNVSRPNLVYVSGMSTGVVSFSAGTNAHGCAVLTGGAAQCWGFNPDGEIGDGTKTPRPSPVNVIGF